jgi:ATP-dependent exoDNAse (exonuclease V) alpha subunit
VNQKQALDILKMGNNVFLTGPAGSGKTYLLNQYITYLKSHQIPVGITASTGIAATHMGGTTIHSWSGMGIRDEMTAQDMGELFKRQYLRNRFLHTKVLIIDEISMLHAHQLDIVNKILKTFKGNDLPFGGLQVILCGDFFQLPPITSRSKTTLGLDSNLRGNDNNGGQNDTADFVTKSETRRPRKRGKKKKRSCTKLYIGTPVKLPAISRPVHTNLRAKRLSSGSFVC